MSLSPDQFTVIDPDTDPVERRLNHLAACYRAGCCIVLLLLTVVYIGAGLLDSIPPTPEVPHIPAFALAFILTFPTLWAVWWGLRIASNVSGRVRLNEVKCGVWIAALPPLIIGAPLAWPLIVPIALVLSVATNRFLTPAMKDRFSN